MSRPPIGQAPKGRFGLFWSQVPGRRSCCTPLARAQAPAAASEKGASGQRPALMERCMRRTAASVSAKVVPPEWNSSTAIGPRREASMGSQGRLGRHGMGCGGVAEVGGRNGRSARQCAPSTAWVERGAGTHPVACRGAPEKRARRLSPGPRAAAALPGRLSPWRRRPSCLAQLWRCRAAQCRPRTRADRNTRCAARRARRESRGRCAPARRRREAARYRSCAVKRSRIVGSEGLWLKGHGLSFSVGSAVLGSGWALPPRAAPQAFRFSRMTS